MLLPSADGASREIRIETPQGSLIGQSQEGLGGTVHSFKGLPYALPPTGSRRWRAAEPARSWIGTRSALAFGPICPQFSEPEGTFYHRPYAALDSEDCLYANVWTPALPGGDAPGLPVMVWIHGGGFSTGAGSFSAYDGSALARKGVIVVTFNYRLGIFGYFAHPDLIAEAGPDGICANFGTTDQIELLRWVQTNIAAFGGDPDRVTIFGESAGGMSVSQLMASPLAKGLFHRAIAQSGAYFIPMRRIGTPSWGGPAAEQIGANVGRAIGAETIAELRAIPAHDLLMASLPHAGLLDGFHFCLVDGKIFPEEVQDVFREGRHHDVPSIVGYNASEGTSLAEYGLAPTDLTTDGFVHEAAERYADLAGSFLALYPPMSPLTSALAAFRDDAYGWPATMWAGSTREGKAWLYRFDHQPPGADMSRTSRGDDDPAVGAHHGAEIAYVFNNMGGDYHSAAGDGRQHPHTIGGDIRPVDRDLADLISDYWISFAATGSPVVEGRPAWKAFSADAPQAMIFEDDISGSRPIDPVMPCFFSEVNARRRAAGQHWWFMNFGLNAAPLRVAVSP